MSGVSASEAVAEWKTQGLCWPARPSLEQSPKWFHPDGRGDENYYAEAIAVCGRCPVSNQCYSFAVENEFEMGVWGGVIFERRVVRSGDWIADQFKLLHEDLDEVETRFFADVKREKNEAFCDWCERQVPADYIKSGNGLRGETQCRDCERCLARSMIQGRKEGWPRGKVFRLVRVLCAEHRWDDNRRRRKYTRLVEYR